GQRTSGRGEAGTLQIAPLFSRTDNQLLTFQAGLRVLSSSKHAFFIDDERGRIPKPTVLPAELGAFHFHNRVSHAPWPEEKHESAPKEAICWPLSPYSSGLLSAFCGSSSIIERSARNAPNFPPVLNRTL